MSFQQGEELTREQAAMTNLSIHIGCFEQNTLSCARCDIPFTDQEPVIRKRTCGCAMHVPCAIEAYAHGNPCAGCNRDPSRGIYPTEADLSRKTQTFRTISQAETMYHGSTDEVEPEIAEHQVHIEDFRDEQIRGVMHEVWRLFTTHESAFLRRTQSFLFADSQVQADYERLLWRMGDIIQDEEV